MSDKRNNQICGIGNTLVDILFKAENSELEKLGLESGTMDLVSEEDLGKLVASFQSEPEYVPGGAVANSIITARALGGDIGFISVLGEDDFGKRCEDDFESLGVSFKARKIAGGSTGRCLSAIGPEAERTMRTHLGVAGELSEGDVSEELIRDSDWLLIEGYLLGNPELGLGAVKKAYSLAERHGTKVALAFCADFVPKVCKESLDELVPRSELVFANLEEAKIYTDTSSLQDSMAKLREQVPGVVITDGANGATISYHGEEVSIPAVACKPVDLTGAGDAFTGAFLYGLSNSNSLEISGNAAAFFASKVISKVGARVSAEVVEKERGQFFS